MLAYKEKKKDKPIKVTTNTKLRTKEQTKNRILGIIMIVLAFITLFLPESKEDGTAFIIMMIMGITAIFS